MVNFTGSSWSDKQDEALAQYWTEGLSASQIAERISGKSRSAILGRAHRLQLASRKKNYEPRHKTDGRSARVQKIRPPRPEKPKPSLALRANCKILPAIPQAEPRPDRPGVSEIGAYGKECRWPIGNPGRPEFHFCGGAVTRNGTSYCDHHYAVAYRPVKPIERPLPVKRFAA